MVRLACSSVLLISVSLFSLYRSPNLVHCSQPRDWLTIIHCCDHHHHIRSRSCCIICLVRMLLPTQSSLLSPCRLVKPFTPVLNTVNNFRSFTTVSISASSPFRMFVFFIHPNIIDYQLRPIWAVWDDVHVKKWWCGDKIDEGWYNAGIHYATRITYFLLGDDDR